MKLALSESQKLLDTGLVAAPAGGRWAATLSD
jgi:hypothetical protein